MSPVQSLQHMLNHLARYERSLPRLAETAAFDEATLEAVMIFQRDHRLPVTGIVDLLTWNAIFDAYNQSLFRFGSPPPLHVFPHGTAVTPEGGSSAEVRIAQAIQAELSASFADFEFPLFDGRNTGATARNFKQVQALAGIPPTGELDRTTWTLLAALFRTFVTKNALGTTLLPD